MFKSLFTLLLLSGNGPEKTEIPPCLTDNSKLTIEKQVELAIGCSTVRGKTVYYNRILEEIVSE